MVGGVGAVGGLGGAGKGWVSPLYVFYTDKGWSAPHMFESSLQMYTHTHKQTHMCARVCIHARAYKGWQLASKCIEPESVGGGGGGREQGFSGLFMGSTPRIGRAAPSVGMVVALYEVVKHGLRRIEGREKGEGTREGREEVAMGVVD